jgi:hypothetical protein
MKTANSNKNISYFSSFSSFTSGVSDTTHISLCSISSKLITEATDPTLSLK